MFFQERYGVDARDVHIIGHSLGAHTAGYAGSLVPGLGRITGLDPAEPYFQVVAFFRERLLFKNVTSPSFCVSRVCRTM